MDAEISDSPSTLQRYLGFTTINTQTIRTWSQLLHIPTCALHPFKYNCSYHRHHINICSRAANTHLIQNLIYWEKLTFHRMLAVISQTQCFFD